jgi:4-amino-4-deoxy-L-arabinose transferase-like glycosyltransferase
MGRSLKPSGINKQGKLGKDLVHPRHWMAGLPIIGGLWLLCAIVDRLWFWVDRSVPAWDQADYLTGCLNYWNALQNPQWFSREWWIGLWLLSSKIPPLTYIATSGIFNLFGTDADQATIVNLLFTGILLLSVYGLGTCLFTSQVGLWAAGLCLFFPAFYIARLDFLLDYPLTAMVALCFCCLTLWSQTKAEGRRQKAKDKVVADSSATTQQKSVNSLISWVFAIAFGLSFGLALLVKQPALFFLLVPILWVGGGAIWQRAWGRLLQLVTGLLVAVLVAFPWYRTNWLLMLTAGKRATVDSAIAEGDPPLNTVEAWIFYLKDLPYVVSWLLLVVPLVGLLLFWRRGVLRIHGGRQQKPELTQSGEKGANGDDRSAIKQRQEIYRAVWRSFRWLLVFGVGAYLLCSLNINKDSRYVMPYLPMLAIVLAYGLLLLPGRRLRWGTIILATVMTGLNLLPLPAGIAAFVQTNRTRHTPVLAAPPPNAEVIAEIVKTEPYLQSTLGVLPSTPTINQHNLNFYGALADFQVYGRQVGTRLKKVAEDARSLSWFVTKSGDQGSIRQPDSLAAIVQQVEQGGDFKLQKAWNLTDGELKLYRRRIPAIEVQPLTGLQQPLSQVKLEQVILPEQAPPGQPVAIAYKWSGTWQQLQTGIVLLTWKPQNEAACLGLSREVKEVQPVQAPGALAQQCWLHDHGIGMGTLHAGYSKVNPNQPFQVVERTAMLPPVTIAPGRYTLAALYLNRETGETYPIETPTATLTISPGVASQPAPELDFVTQLRTAALALPQGLTGLSDVFDRIGQLNQYDPVQDYLNQARYALTYRLQQAPQNSEFAYGLALADVLKRRVDAAIVALQKVVQLDPQNPYAYAYLAFVNLYDFRPHAAQQALAPALQLQPNSKELQILDGVAALMRGNLIRAWQVLQTQVL